MKAKSNPQKARLTNDVRYQDSTEITLDAPIDQRSVKGYFFLCWYSTGYAGMYFLLAAALDLTIISGDIHNISAKSFEETLHYVHLLFL